MTFDEFFRQLLVRYFTADEVATWRRGPRRLNSEPPERYWTNIVPTILILDELRDMVDEPIVITSTYRDPEYNRRVGGVSRSQHLVFGAIDFHLPRGGVPLPDVAHNLKLLRGCRLESPIRLADYADDGTPSVPRIELPRWDRRGTPATIFEWHGGVGLYPTFIHVDSRGSDVDW